MADNKRSLEYIISLTDKISAPIKAIEQQFSSLEDTLVAIGTIGAAFAGTVMSIGAFVNTNLDALDTVQQLQNVTGIASKDIYEWGKVAEVSGSSSEAMQASIEGLSKTIGEASQGVGKGAKAFEQYGLSIGKINEDGSKGVKNALEVMEDLRVKMVDMDSTEQVAMLQKLGIDKSLVQLLRASNDEMEDALKTAHALSLGVAEDTTAAATFKDALTLVTQAIKGASQYISIKLAPALTEIMRLFTDWFIENNDFVKNSLDVVTHALGELLKFIFKTVRAIDRIIQATIGWKGVIIGVIAVLALLKKATIITFLTNPITKMAAGVITLILLFEDLIVYMNGGKSYFGKKWEPFVKIIRTLQALFAKIQPVIDGVIDKIKAIAPAVLGVIAGVYAFKGVIALFTPIFGVLSSMASAFFTLLRVGFLTTPIGWLIAAVGVLVYYFKDELLVFVKGVIAGFQEWGVSFEPITQAFDALGSALNPVFEWIASLLGVSTEVSGEFGTWQAVGEVVGKVLSWILQGIIDLVANLVKMITWVIDGFKKLWDKAVGIYNSIAELFGKEPIKIPVEVAMPEGVNVPAMSGSATVASNAATQGATQAATMAKVMPATAQPLQTASNVAPLAATKPQAIPPLKGVTPKSFAPTNGKTVSNVTQNNQRSSVNHITINATTTSTPKEIGDAVVKAQERAELGS